MGGAKQLPRQSAPLTRGPAPSIRRLQILMADSGSGRPCAVGHREHMGHHWRPHSPQSTQAFGTGIETRPQTRKLTFLLDNAGKLPNPRALFEIRPVLTRFPFVFFEISLAIARLLPYSDRILEISNGLAGRPPIHGRPWFVKSECNRSAPTLALPADPADPKDPLPNP